MRWAEHIAHVENIRNAYKILIRQPEEKRSLGRRRYRWKDNTEMYLKWL